ncbi:39S ribosomal protein L16, mitochondrial [Coccinella septempunctata]|uniref:39S ribosomal protein L16, mitochondrial n=1 Tax=Coccinella septempunctata TaxID=41139 RepID=UPI001D09158A|nr:39S ribosomal protein L16, mitochondrial [Coccinella septempunctata]
MNSSQLLRTTCISLMQRAGFKYFPRPRDFNHIEIPEKAKLKFIDKVPQFPPSIRPPKMQKRLRYMRGPEEVHNTLQYKQYGIMALGGGRLKWNHFEMMRLTVGRKMDSNRMFAVWRVDAPWQPVTKKGQGQRMGGGKGGIDHYVTPIKAGRIIFELGGKCEYAEVKDFLEDVARKMPFKAMAVSQEILDQMKADEKWEQENNKNKFTMKYMIQNNMGGCHTWLSPYDFKFLGKYT